MEFKRYSKIRAKTVLELVLENAVTRAHGSWSLLAVWPWAPGETDHVTLEIFHGISFQTSKKLLSLLSL